MRLRPVPILGILREVWSAPRDMKRFHAYIERVRGGPGGEIVLPLVSANPMAREHMLAYADALDAIDADRIVAEACAAAERRLDASPLETRLSLVPVDDLGGTWSDKDMTSFANRCGEDPAKARALLEKYGYVVALVYASEPPTRDHVWRQVLACAYRAAYVHRHGGARTVGEMLTQEGNALRFAGAPPPAGVDLAASRRALASHLDATLHATRFAALMGDEAAAKLGHKPLGLPAGAALAVALTDALAAKEAPETLV